MATLAKYVFSGNTHLTTYLLTLHDMTIVMSSSGDTPRIGTHTLSETFLEYLLRSHSERTSVKAYLVLYVP